MQGRETGTESELRAAEFIASQLKAHGIKPAGDPAKDGGRSYIQKAPLNRRALDAAPELKAAGKIWTHGKDVSFVFLGESQFKGPLQRLKPGDAVKPGAVVLVTLQEGVEVRGQILGPLRNGATAVLVNWAEQVRQGYEGAAKELPEIPLDPQPYKYVILGADASKQFADVPEGAEVSFTGKLKELPPAFVSTVIGVLPGETDEAILLGAHLDHLGIATGRPGDNIYNGADDDASGCAAVMELARVLGAGKKPLRTVFFAFFGGEEIGGVGAGYFLQYPPLNLEKIVADIEFEMIGRPDNKVPAKTLWLTGFDRSDLGPELAKHGARLVADPHPDQNFFARSDNYPLAKRGIIAHTVSSFGLHAQYHQPDDDIAHVDFQHMTTAIGSLIEPIQWLVNSDFKPQWLPGKKP
ncbi:MAG: M20/M25/M40 family metallo-hydrolase [Acidobacteriales bacterium]|nr:M20/M25/M40 family metallo-hydrolase [Terriglobales bacterium]